MQIFIINLDLEAEALSQTPFWIRPWKYFLKSTNLKLINRGAKILFIMRISLSVQTWSGKEGAINWQKAALVPQFYYKMYKIYSIT